MAGRKKAQKPAAEVEEDLLGDGEQYGDGEASHDRARAGDNLPPGANTEGTVDPKYLKAFVDRALRVEGEISDLRSDLNDIYAEAKGQGFNVKILRKIVAEERKDQDKLDEEISLLDLYRSVLQRAK